MIILTLAGDKFALASLADAEALLPILSRAVPVNTGYVSSGGFRELVYTRLHGGDLSIAIVAGEPISEREFEALKAKDEADKPAKKTLASAGAAQ